MATPKADLSRDGDMFKDEAYFLAVLEFLALHNWIYDFKVTKFFSERIWERIDPEWTEALLEISNDELNQLPYGFYKESWPASLREFITKALQFSITRNVSDHVAQAPIPKEIQRGMTPKKLHEVSRLGGVISVLMTDQTLDTVIDVGAGLGYLGHVLNQQYGYRVISLECEAARTHGAENRTRNKQDDLSTNPQISSVTFELKDDCESRDEFENILHHLHDSSRCADCLTPNTDCVCDDRSEQAYNRLPSLNEPSATSVDHTEGDICTSCGRASLNIPVEPNNLLPTQVNRERISSPDVSLTNVGYVTSAIQESEHWHRDDYHGTSCENTDNIKDLFSVQSNVSIDNSDDSSCQCRQTEKRRCSQTYNIPRNEMSLDGWAKNKDYSSCPYTTVHASSKDDSSVKTDFAKSYEDVHDSEQCSTMDGNVCMIGLHCCGDLTPSMLGYFRKFDAVTALCCVSCCYHRMARSKVTDNNDAINFPMSQACQRSLKHVQMYHQGWCLSQYAFRLAAQETRARWREQTIAQHEVHTRNVAYRALLEILIEQEAGFKKLVRKVVRKSHFESFAAYISAALDRVDIRSNTSGIVPSKRQDLEAHLHRLHEEFKPYFHFIEPITALQVLLQPVLETLIHSDRRQYLKEYGFTAELTPVFDECISPRNIALIAKKS